MVHLRLVVPPGLVRRVRHLLTPWPVVFNVVHLEGASLKPRGDVILCDVAREDASVVISELRALGLGEQGSISIEEVERAGLPVALEVSGKRSPLPTALDQAAYRIAQEALTNALKHGGRGAKAALNLTYGPEHLELEITDDGGGHGVELPSGTKKGLIGMRERVEMFGGAFEAGPLPGAGFRVRARLPLGERLARGRTGV